MVDLVPPTPITMTLSYVNTEGMLTPLSAGQTIYDVSNPTLQLTWTPASDGSGLRSYFAGLSQVDPPDLSNLTPVGPNAALQVNQATSEAQAYTAYVVSQDNYGNLSWNHIGPIYIDTPLTPDLIACRQPGTFITAGWIVVTQIGMSRILSDTSRWASR
jgi:hypothetical protein